MTSHMISTDERIYPTGDKNYLRITLGLASGGTAFSGYLSAVRLLTGSCAFNESCPFFLGYPACWTDSRCSLRYSRPA